jgi:hypothetical protein
LARGRFILFADRVAGVRFQKCGQFLEALYGLQRRSLLEQNEAGFTLQNVVTEYLTAYLIDQISEEIHYETPRLLNSHALIIAQAYEYVRESQVRMILQPIAVQLVATLGKVQLVEKLKRILAKLHTQEPLRPGYAGGNLLNLLLHLGVNMRGYDFSRLCVWQAYLQGVQLPETSSIQPANCSSAPAI